MRRHGAPFAVCGCHMCHMCRMCRIRRRMRPRRVGTCFVRVEAPRVERVKNNHNYHLKMIIMYTSAMAVHTDERLLTSAEAAARLGVTQNRVQAMVRQGRLRAVHIDSRRLLIPLQSVKDARRYAGHRGRPYAEGTAMAMLFLLSGERAEWLTAQQAYRIRGQLSRSSADALVRGIRGRAIVHEYQASVRVAEAISKRIRQSASSQVIRKSLQLMESEVSEGYVTLEELSQLERLHRMNADLKPVRVRLHVSDYARFWNGSAMPRAFCAADLAESSDIREQAAGMRLITQLLDDYQRGELR